MKTTHPTVTPRPLILGLAALLAAASTQASPVLPVAYDMPNGDGQAHGGSFNYWDRSYNGAGNTTLDGAFLAGGTGDLTDGYIESQNWFAVENGAGTGPYVGWRRADINPVSIKFRFTGNPYISTATVYADDSNNIGGVMLPRSIDVIVDGTFAYSQTVFDPASANPIAITLPINATIANTIDLTLHYSSEWIFLSEVGFDGKSAGVPDGGNLLGLLAAGSLLTGWLARRR